MTFIQLIETTTTRRDEVDASRTMAIRLDLLCTGYRPENSNG
jgi:hypothetical protein